MSTCQILGVDLADFIVRSCPHCKTCSIGLSNYEYDQVQAGQQMITFCNVCGQEVVFDAENS